MNIKESKITISVTDAEGQEYYQTIAFTGNELLALSPDQLMTTFIQPMVEVLRMTVK